MKVKITAIILALTVVFTGCSTSEAINNGNETINHGVEFQKETESDTEQSTQKVAYEKYQGKLMDFSKVLDFKDFPVKGEKYTVDWEDEDGKAWQGDKGDYISIGPGSIGFYAKEYEYNYDTIMWKDPDELDQYFAGLTKNVKEISGITEEEAVEKITTLINKYGINAGNVKAYPLNAKVLNKIVRDFQSDEEYEKYIKDGNDEAGKKTGTMKRDFTKDDEIYAVSMEPMVGKYTLFDSEYDYGEGTYESANIWALVSKDKIIRLETSGLYETCGKSVNIEKILTKEEAGKLLDEKYQALLLPDKIVCQNILIKYIAVNQKKKNAFEFIPVYVFQVKYPIKLDKESKITYSVQKVMLDAENGKWIE